MDAIAVHIAVRISTLTGLEAGALGLLLCAVDVDVEGLGGGRVRLGLADGGGLWDCRQG